MLERVHEAADNAEKKTLPWLRESLAGAREKAVELGELTREEAERVSRYVERDLHEAASFIADTGQGLRDWLSFDWKLVQNRMLEMFAGMADQTSQALRGFAEQAREASLYHSGEVAAPGTLVCTECGAEITLETTGRVPECPTCGATRFQRKVTSST
ncbi:MAG: zinc ribbon-containing protein [Chromatiaceae bacterium]|nr:zinc ribbon-containing protein [Gammaproteobacteria bacterium]MCP5422929.1 zinc ribbon-containing protein [Chromatiaceae bacterium]